MEEGKTGLPPWNHLPMRGIGMGHHPYHPGDLATPWMDLSFPLPYRLLYLLPVRSPRGPRLRHLDRTLRITLLVHGMAEQVDRPKWSI